MAERRVLFLTQVLPHPLDSGAKVRAYYVLRHLAGRFRVTLVSFVRPDDSRESVAHLSEFCEAVSTVPVYRSFLQDAASLAWGIATNQPALIVRERSPEYRATVRRLLGEEPFDAIHVDQIKTACQLEGVKDLPPRLIDKHNVYWEMVETMAGLERRGLRRRLLRREARTMKVYETTVCRSFDEIVAVTERDAGRLAELTGSAARVTTIPICIDPDEWRAVETKPDSHDLLFYGAMFYPPNVDGVLWFIRDVLPRVWKEAPEVRLRIVGARPAREIRQAAKGEPRIRLEGYAENLEPHMQSCVACVVPLRAGSGMRVKILDALARGLPVISTRLGAEGIRVEDGESVLLADGADGFAAGVVRLVRDDGLRRRLAVNGRQVVEEHYDWRKRYGAFDDVYERLFAAGGAQR